ncbi:MAG: ABC transporter permease [Chloroflexi bacterium]|nr:ABC transporter permease [Chloroflexota bacterium]
MAEIESARQPVAAARPRGRDWNRVLDLLWPVVTLGLLVLAWQLYIWIGDVPLYVLAPPLDAAEAAFTNAGELFPDALVTLKEMALGLLIAVGVAIPLAILIDSSAAVEKLVYPILVTSQVVPLVAIAPVIVLVLGFGITPKIVIVALFATFPIVLESLVGLRSLEQEKVYLARAIGAGPLAFFFRIKIPNALPHILTGFKLAGTLSVIGAVVAEFIAANEGLGHYVLNANANQNTIDMLGGIIWLAVIGIGVFFLLDLLERFLIPWHVSRRLEAGGMRTT